MQSSRISSVLPLCQEQACTCSQFSNFRFSYYVAMLPTIINATESNRKYSQLFNHTGEFGPALQTRQRHQMGVRLCGCDNNMSEQQSGQNHEQVPKNKEEAERKFGCPCGKWYLSYPALFTHVKQKHDGKAPGQLIKPKTDKTRGRPRLPTNNNEEENSVANFDCVEELERAVANKQADYEEGFEFSEGNETCQDMASHFLRIMGGSGEEKKVITCFLNYLRFFIKRRYEDNYWETHRPSDIIDISNEMVKEHQNHQEAFPIDKETLIELLYALFRWMYKNKWTDHKLLKRNADQPAKN